MKVHSNWVSDFFTFHFHSLWRFWWCLAMACACRYMNNVCTRLARHFCTPRWLCIQVHCLRTCPCICSCKRFCRL